MMSSAKSQVDVKSAWLPSWLSGILIYGGGIAFLLLLMLIHITQGEAGVKFGTVIEAVFAPSDLAEYHIVRTLRMPRAVIGVIAGAALAVSGVLLQTVTRNPLSSAGTLGINAGAYFMVVAAVIFAPKLASSYSVLLALVGGIAAALLSYVLAGGKWAIPVRMALAGTVVGMAISAFTGALQMMFSNETAKLFLFGAGSLVQNDWSGVTFAWPWIAGGILLSVFLARSLDLMELGEEVARSLGQSVSRTRFAGLGIAVLLASIIVSVVGPIGFVGLIAPHLMRLLGYRRHLKLIPAAAIWGAVVVVGADALARIFANYVGEMPVGAMTAAIGAPWLIWLAYRAGRSGKEVPKSSRTSAGALSRKIPFPVLAATCGVLLFACVIAGLALGGIKISVSDIFAVFSGSGPDMARNIILDLRLPRLLVAAFAGASLAVSGLLLQGVVRNPLADPSIVGVTAGAGCGALLMLVIWPELPVVMLPIGAFAGAVLAAAIVYVIAWRTGLQPAVLALVGIAVSAFGSAGIQLLVIKAQMFAAGALAWLSGTTYARGWEELSRLLLWPALLLPLAWYYARKLDVSGFGDEVATNLGLQVNRTRLVGGVIGVALAAASVATVGTVGFVGLLAPHAARMLAGHNHRRLVVLSALLGAFLLVLADVVGRIILIPKDIPSGLVVAVLGAPYFLWLMHSSSRAKG